ncbi:MAG: hypothetical protein CML13_17365, partial [Puniceicoccaceae bacterium]|nr:hypothetical protein [Puniceicoccaceae bacterium]
SVAKQKKPGAKKFRKAIGQQLNYLKRNLGHIEKLDFEPVAFAFQLFAPRLRLQFPDFAN